MLNVPRAAALKLAVQALHLLSNPDIEPSSHLLGHQVQIYRRSRTHGLRLSEHRSVRKYPQIHLGSVSAINFSPSLALQTKTLGHRFRMKDVDTWKLSALFKCQYCTSFFIFIISLVLQTYWWKGKYANTSVVRWSGNMWECIWTAGAGVGGRWCGCWGRFVGMSLGIKACLCFEYWIILDRYWWQTFGIWFHHKIYDMLREVQFVWFNYKASAQ